MLCLNVGLGDCRIFEPQRKYKLLRFNGHKCLFPLLIIPIYYKEEQFCRHFEKFFHENFPNLSTCYLCVDKHHKIMNELTRRKIANTLKGRKRSATTAKRISQALKGRKLSDKHKQHISEAMRLRKLKSALRDY